MNFALILFVLTCVTFLFWVAERWKFLPERRRKAEDAARRFEADNREAIDRGDATVIDERNRLSERILRQPWWLEYTAGLFPVIAVVFLLRSFLFEPFRIPSGSMLPTLHIGDFILVNKFDYGIRLPVTNTKIIPVGSPERGDVVVFKYPMDTQVDYIKRVVGLPGDTVEYRDKVLYVNGVEQKQTGSRDFVDDSTMITLVGSSPGDFAQGKVLRLQRTGLRVHRPRRPLLHDGRQSRQQRRQPLLGVRARRRPGRPRRPDLGELRRHGSRGRLPLSGRFGPCDRVRPSPGTDSFEPAGRALASRRAAASHRTTNWRRRAHSRSDEPGSAPEIG